MIARSAMDNVMPAPLQGSASRRRARFSLADICYVSLKVSGWLAVTASCVVAVYALMFLMLGEFSLTGFMSHVDNLAGRYLAADTVRRVQFESHLFAVSAEIFGLIGFFRRHSLLPLIAGTKETVHDNT